MKKTKDPKTIPQLVDQLLGMAPEREKSSNIEDIRLKRSAFTKNDFEKSIGWADHVIGDNSIKSYFGYGVNVGEGYVSFRRDYRIKQSRQPSIDTIIASKVNRGR